MKIGKIIITLLLFVFLTSCVYNRSTAYTNKEVIIGMDKGSITKRYGRPFKESLAIEHNDTIEVFCYKERIYVGAYEYILNTYFHFKNSKLFKKEQTEDEPPSDVSIKVKK